jgi:DAACS family dicarboxylate/amino acid:cation (Na+ or H+) symporter
MLDSYVPRSIAQPVVENMVLTVAVLAILLGAAMRSLKGTSDAQLAEALGAFERLITASFQIVVKMLAWLIELAPFAICFVIAGVVGATEDLGALVERVGVYFATVMAALGLHALVYYPLSAWLIGGVPPRTFFREGAGAILTGFSINSSLATAPLTLKALGRMRVSDSSARLSACVGTNFNNDGITLYEAMTALFVAQAAGMELHIAQQIPILLVVLAGSMGIAGIPNSGLIILTLVLKAARLPEEAVNLALPIIYSIDFINARVRSAVNVMGDMQVAILLDAPAARDARDRGESDRPSSESNDDEAPP